MGKGRVRRVQGAKAASATFAAAVPRRSSFDVAALPYDLREYLGTFLAQKDAVKLMRVSRDFHEVFSRVVWRVIHYTQFITSRRSRLYIWPSAWQRYGRLVRLLIVDRPIDDSVNLGELVPNVMYLKLSFEGEYYGDIGLQQLAPLRNLRAVKVSDRSNMSFLLRGLIEWLNNESQSGQVETVSMAVSSADGQVIPSIMNKVRNLRRLRLIAIYGLRDVARMDHWTRLSTVCAELEIMAGSEGDLIGDSEHRCMSAQLGPFLDNRRGVYFPYLTRATVVGCCLHQATLAYAALIPANFPVLTRLGLLLLPKECDQNPGQIMLRIFKSDWSQLTSLSFVGCFSSKELDFALSATPNVRKLYCNMMASLLDFEVIRSRLPRLVDLELRSKKNIYSQPKQSSAVTSRIRRVHIQTTIVSIDLLRFIFTALPGLRELFIDNCQIQEDAARYGVRQSAKTPLANLDSVVLSAAVGTPLAEHMVTLIPAFANAAKLCVHASREQKEQICAKYPHITLREKLD